MAKIIDNKEPYIDDQILKNYLNMISKNLLYYKDGKLYVGIGEICTTFEVKDGNDWESENWKLGQIFEKLNLKDLGVKAIEEVSGLTPDVETTSPIKNLENCDPTLNGIIFEIDIEKFKKAHKKFTTNPKIELAEKPNENGGNKKTILYLDKNGNLFDGKNRCYKISEKSKRHALIRFLIENKGYQPTNLITNIARYQNDHATRVDIARIRKNIWRDLKIKERDFLQNKEDSGYRINPKYKIKIKD